jgi:hypothetical protein
VAAVTVARGCDAISIGTTVYCKQQMVVTANLQRVNSSTFERTDYGRKQSSYIRFNEIGGQLEHVTNLNH